MPVLFPVAQVLCREITKVMPWVIAVANFSVGSATATPRAAVEISTIQTKRFFMAMLLMCSPLNSGIGDIVEGERLTR